MMTRQIAPTNYPTTAAPVAFPFVSAIIAMNSSVPVAVAVPITRCDDGNVDGCIPPPRISVVVPEAVALKRSSSVANDRREKVGRHRVGGEG